MILNLGSRLRRIISLTELVAVLHDSALARAKIAQIRRDFENGTAVSDQALSLTARVYLRRD
jgi:hypothetical protein